MTGKTRQINGVDLSCDSEQEGVSPADLEARARRFGWRPESEWVGAPPVSGFVDAKAFIERGETMVPILNSKLKTVRARLAAVRETSVRASKFMADANARARKQRDAAIAGLEEAREKAAKHGDGPAFACADEQVRDLESGAVDTDACPVQAVQQFLAENRWYSTDPGLRAFADEYAEILKKDGLLGKPMLDKIAQRTKEVFAHLSDDHRSAGPVEGENWKRFPIPQQKKYDDLPDDAKAVCDLFIADGIMTREDYVKNYEWDE